MLLRGQLTMSLLLIAYNLALYANYKHISFKYLILGICFCQNDIGVSHVYIKIPLYFGQNRMHCINLRGNAFMLIFKIRI